MKITISGQHLSVGDSLKAHIEAALEKIVTKYFDRAIAAHVTLTKERNHLIRTDILVNEGTSTGIAIKSGSEDYDAYRSFDAAVSKAEHQLRRHKDRIKAHQKNKDAIIASFEATKYTISPFGDESKEASPVIIAEKATAVDTLSVGEAVMKMDLQDLNAYIFVNSANNRINMVYYKKDGNIAWLDVPEYKKS
jgi:ribosomal subunit interface protein